MRPIGYIGLGFLLGAAAMVLIKVWLLGGVGSPTPGYIFGLAVGFVTGVLMMIMLFDSKRRNEEMNKKDIEW